MKLGITKMNPYLSKCIDTLPILIECEACSNDISKHSKFCPSCGHPSEKSIIFNLGKMNYLDLSGVSQGLYESILPRYSISRGESRLDEEDLPKTSGFNFTDAFKNLQGLDISTNENLDINSLQNLVNLKFLNLQNCYIKNLAPISPLNSLEILVLDTGSCWHLNWNHSLSSANEFNEGNIDVICKLGNLEYLILDGASYRPSWEYAFEHSIPNCKVICLSKPLSTLQEENFRDKEDWIRICAMKRRIEYFKNLD